MKTTTQRRIGATDAAKLLGVSKYGTALDVYERIVLGKTVKPNRQMARGTREEPRVLRLYQESTGAQLLPLVMPCIIEHPNHPCMTSSPDAVTTDNVLVEFKTASVWAKGWSDGPPIDYVLQCAHSMCVGNFDACHLFAAFGSDVGDEFHIERTALYVLERDAALEADIIEACERFWREHVLPKVPPTPGLSADSLSA